MTGGGHEVGAGARRGRPLGRHRSTWASLDRRAHHVLVSTLAANALLFFDQTAVVVALPAIQRELSASASEVQWVVTAYLLALTALMASAGRLADTFGRRRFYLGGLALFGVGSVACALAPGIGALIAARFLQGAGGAIVAPIAFGTTTRAVPAEHRGWAVGVFSAGGTTFLAAGPLLAGALLGVASWRWVFLITLPVTLLSLVQGVRWLEPSRAASPLPVRPGPVLVLLAGLTAAVVGTTQLDAWGWWAVASLGAGLAALAGFARHELRTPTPLIPLRDLGEPALAASLAALGAIQFVVLGLTVHLVVLLQHGLGASALAAGAVLALAGTCTPLLSTTTGRLTDRHGPRSLVLGGLVLVAAGLGWLALAAPALDVAWLLPGLLAVSLGRPAVFTPAGVAPTALLPADARGLASSLVTESRQLGAVVGVAVLGAVSGFVAGGAAIPEPDELARGFQAAMAVAAAVAALAAVAVWRLMPAGAAPGPGSVLAPHLGP